MREVVNVYWTILQREKGLTNFGTLDLASLDYWALKDLLLRVEREILSALGYMLYVELPHKFCLSYLQVQHRLPAAAWLPRNSMRPASVELRE